MKICSGPCLVGRLEKFSRLKESIRFLGVFASERVGKSRSALESPVITECLGEIAEKISTKSETEVTFG